MTSGDAAITSSAESPLRQSFDAMRSFLGKRVTVTLDYDDPKAKQTGVLHHIDEWGEVHIKDDEGAMHYCWPCLSVEAASD